MSSFLAGLTQYSNHPVAVHTGADVYTGRLVTVTSVWVILDSDSDVLDGCVTIHIDAARVEAVEVLSR